MNRWGRRQTSVMVLQKLILSTPLNITAARAISIFARHTQRIFLGSTGELRHPTIRVAVVDSLVEGCDYNRWLVVMQSPENYPQRQEIVQQYVTTLAMVLGSEKAAKESIYSVSTKNYYAFSCKVAENITQ